MISELREKPQVPFDLLPEKQKESIMRRVRALISNGFCRAGLIAWGVSKLEEQLIIMRDLGFVRVTKSGKIEMYHITKCKYVEIAVQIGGRRPRRKP